MSNPPPVPVAGDAPDGDVSASESIWERLLAVLASLRSTEGADLQEESSRNGLAMVLSVVVALVLWFTFSMQATYTIPVRVPIVIDALPEAAALRSRPPQTVVVQLQGVGWDLLGFSRNPPPLRLIATSASVDLMAAMGEISLPGNVTVQGVQPRSLELDLDTWTSRRLPIRLVQRIAPAPGHDLLRPPLLEPDSVLVSGAQSLLGMLSDWPTDLLQVSDARGEIRATVALRDTLSGLLTASVASTNVVIPIGEFTEGERMLTVEVRNLPASVSGVRFDPPQVRARYRVPLTGNVYERAAASSAFVAVVDYGDIARDTTSGTVPLAARPPAGLDIRDVILSPSRVEYFLLRRSASPPTSL